MRERVKRLLLIGGVTILNIGLIAGLGLIAGEWRLAKSLPIVDAELAVRGLAHRVVIHRDALGIPTVIARNRRDAAFATGFIHAQERFFQMDLQRRNAAGELAELFGEAALATDKSYRLHRFRERAERTLARLPGWQRRLLSVYTQGVNSGLDHLESRPPEYLLLGTAPRPWQAADSLLCVYAMYLTLQQSNVKRESDRGLMHALLPEPLYRFLSAPGSSWDAPLQGKAYATPAFPRHAPLPPAATIHAAPAFANAMLTPPPLGSNAWAVSGALTPHGGAMLANDMHLGLRLPNIWFRAVINFTAAQDRQRQIAGVTLPGIPAIVVGSNGRLAWGFTNAYADTSDLVLIDAVDAERYLTPQGPAPYAYRRERIQVKNREPVEYTIKETIWGPIIDRDPQGRERALRWIAHDPLAVDIGLLAMESAATVDNAIMIAHRAGLPAQNILIATASGDIAWTIAGQLPVRHGHSGRIPVSWSSGKRGWQGKLDPRDYPKIVNPPGGRLWSANHRHVDGGALDRISDGGFALGARAKQIQQRLQEKDRFTEGDFLAIQLDVEARFLRRWQRLLLAVLAADAAGPNPDRAALRETVAHWTPGATVDSVGYRLVREYRLIVAELVYAPLVARCTAADPTFRYQSNPQWEGALWKMVDEQPRHLLNPAFASWPALFGAAVDRLLPEHPQVTLPKLTWGSYQMTRFEHPFSRAAPFLSAWLDLRQTPLPGDLYMPRIKALYAGASQRMVVAPGHENTAIFHMPGGQSGNPLSPHYRDGHRAWVRGDPTPLLPGAAVHTLTLLPAGGTEPTGGVDDTRQ